MPKLVTAPLAISALLALASPVHAAEGWLCQYARHNGGRSLEAFHIGGDRLVSVEGDVQSDYAIIANDERAIVAAYGGGYASEPAAMAFTVMIDKVNGRFVRSTASVGDLGYKETGTCRRADDETAKPSLPRPKAR